MTQVLIVDDHEQNLYMLQVLLQGYGYEVRSARNGIEALDMARRQAPDLIITDILMPGMDGFSLCREWMADERLQHVPLVFYTATYTDSQDEAFALSLGAARFIVKPTEPDAFVEILRQVLEDHAAQRLVPLVGPSQAAEVYYQQYNQALIRKLEDKMVQLEEANRALELDITERKQAEEMLQKTEQDYRMLTENSPDLIARFDTRLRHLYVNPAAARAGKLSASEYIGLTIAESGVPEPVATAWDQRIRQVLRTGKMMDVEGAFPTPEGIRYFHTRLVPELTPDGSVCSVLSVARDITERKRAEEALRESEEQYRVLFEGSTHGILATDIETRRFVDANPSMCRMLGYSAAELLQLGLADIHPKDALDNLMSAMQTQTREGKAQSFGIPCLRKDGTVFYTDIGGAITIVHGRRCIVGFFADVTERKRAEEEIKKQLEELRRWHKTTLGRETRILDLKREVNELLAQVGQPPRYPSAESENP